MEKTGRNITRYPAVREFTADTGRIGRDKHYIRSLLEVDVTDALQRLKEMRSPDKKLSFQAWFIKVLGDSVAHHPPIDGVRAGKHAVMSFDEIDVSTIVEKRVEGVGVPLPLIIRAVNKKTALEVQEEINQAIHQAVNDAGDYVLGSEENTLMMRLAAAIPQWLRLFIMRVFVLSNPARLKKMMGTVVVTSLGMTGRLSGWIIPTSMHPLSIGIGSLNKKATIHKGEIVKRDILHLTIAIDHDVVDGMPALRFVDELVSKLEEGYQLGS